MAAPAATARKRVARRARRDCGKRVDNWWNTCADVADGKKRSERRARRSAASGVVDELRSFVRLIAAVRSLEYRFASTGFDLIDHHRPTLDPTHLRARLPRRGHASHRRALAGARDQRARRADRPHALL